MELFIILPCFNEAESLPCCIREAQETIRTHRLSAEIIVAANGSTDDSVRIASKMGTKVVMGSRRGYGAAVKAGIAAARGKYIVMLDADGSYTTKHIPRILDKLRQGYDLVVANRFMGGIRKGAMSLSHILGNYFLSFIGRLCSGTTVRDFHSGLRGFSTRAIHQMRLSTKGFEYDTEMILKAASLGMDIVEVPTILLKDSRTTHGSYIRAWSDGWKVLFLTLSYCSPLRWCYAGVAVVLLTQIVLRIAHGAY